MQNHYELLHAMQRIISQVKVARFNAPTDDNVFSIPCNIVHIQRTDDDGSVWFFTYCKKGLAAELKNFYATLDFYNKQHGLVLQLKGIANIAEDTGSSNDNIVLIQLKPAEAVYSRSILQHHSWMQRMLENLNHWFSPQEKIYFQFT